MKVINDLVVVEVPREAYDFRANGAAGFAYSLPNSGYWHIVDSPFPCTIIGTLDDLANSSTKKNEVIHAAKHTNGILTSLLLTHGIISMTPDINKPDKLPVMGK